MSQSEVERFATTVREDKTLQDELKKAAVSNEAIVAFAKSKGYDLNLNEVIQFVEARKATMSDADLDKVAGGKKKGIANVGTAAEVLAEAVAVSVTVAVEAQDVATSSTVAAEAECVIIAT